MQFPTVTGSNLERQQLTLPSDLEGGVNLVVIAFWCRHQALVDTWMPAATDLEMRHSDFAVYELPVIQNRSRLSQWFIDSGMRAGIPDRRVRQRTITLYLDKPGFMEALGISDDDTVVSMLIDRDGQVLWRADGAMADESATALANVLEKRSVA